jgi:hypothetical protein
MFCNEFLKRLPSPEQQKFYLLFRIYHISSHYCSPFKLRILNKNHARCTREIKSSIAMTKALFNKKKILFIKPIRLIFKEETSKVLHLEHSFVWG